jgi:hypothetical protein
MAYGGEPLPANPWEAKDCNQCGYSSFATWADMDKDQPTCHYWQVEEKGLPRKIINRHNPICNGQFFKESIRIGRASE